MCTGIHRPSALKSSLPFANLSASDIAAMSIDGRAERSINGNANQLIIRLLVLMCGAKVYQEIHTTIPRPEAPYISSDPYPVQFSSSETHKSR